MPAAVGVKLAKPDHQVWALQGDGGMLFGQTEALWPMRPRSADHQGGLREPEE